MFYLMIASGSFSDEHPVLFWIGLLLLFVVVLFLFLASLSGLGEGLEETGRSVGNAIKDSDWYKAREERKEIEAMERQLKKKELEEKARNTGNWKRRTK